MTRPARRNSGRRRTINRPRGEDGAGFDDPEPINVFKCSQCEWDLTRCVPCGGGSEVCRHCKYKRTYCDMYVVRGLPPKMLTRPGMENLDIRKRYRNMLRRKCCTVDIFLWND